MKKFILASAIALISSPAWAGTGTQVSVPEMDGGAAVAAIALLVGAAAIIRERRNRK